MRRIAVLVVGLLLFSAAPALSAPMDPYAGTEQTAIALWIERDGNKGTLYAAIGTRGVGSFGGVEALPAYGVVGKGPCRFGKHMGWCWATGRGKTLGVQDFSMDPLLDGAHMTMAQGGHTHVVDWTGKGNPQADARESIGDEHYVSVSMFRRAPATAKLYGKRMTGHRSFNFMVSGAFLGSGLGRFVTFRPDGTVRFRVPIRGNLR